MTRECISREEVERTERIDPIHGRTLRQRYERDRREALSLLRVTVPASRKNLVGADVEPDLSALAAVVRMKKRWVVDVLHQAFAGERMGPGIAAEVPDIYVFALPVADWGRANDSYHANNLILESSGLKGEFTGAPNGEDGHVILPRRTVFTQIGGNGTKTLAVDAQRFPLEVGTISSERVMMILRRDRVLARLPYPILDVEPHLFLLAYTGSPTSPDTSAHILDALLK